MSNWISHNATIASSSFRWRLLDGIGVVVVSSLFKHTRINAKRVDDSEKMGQAVCFAGIAGRRVGGLMYGLVIAGGFTCFCC